MPKQNLSKNGKHKLKMKKNAHDQVDYDLEKKLDPKFKTELCKSWCDRNICVYGNKCRFAHGKDELSLKQVNSQKYKQRECNSFKENGVCIYGNRCNFKHDERKFNQIDRSYFSYHLKMNKPRVNRLAVFKNISQCQNKNNKIVSDGASYVYNSDAFNYIFLNLSVIFGTEGKDFVRVFKNFHKITGNQCENMIVNFNSLMSSWY